MNKKQVKTFLRGIQTSIERLRETIDSAADETLRTTLQAQEDELHGRLNTAVHALADFFDDEEIRAVAQQRTGGQDKDKEEPTPGVDAS